MSSVIFVFLLTTIQVQGQKVALPKFSVGVDVGTGTFVGEVDKQWYIRQDIGASYYGDYYHQNSIYGDMSYFHVGIKSEYALNDKCSVLAGLKYKRIYSDIQHDGRRNFFYLRYVQDESDLEFFRVRSIKEYNHYLSMPLEVKYVPLHISGWFAFYGKLGVDLGMLIQSEKGINFKSESMYSYEDEVLEKMIKHDANSFFSSYYAAIGFSFFPTHKVTCSVDVFLPAGLFTSHQSSLIDPFSYGGVQCFIQIPLSKIEKNNKNVHHE